MSTLNGFDSSTELIYASDGAATAKDTFTSEVTINNTGGMATQAKIPPQFWNSKSSSPVGKTLRVVARGIVSSTGTPNYTLTLRGGGAASTSGPILLGSAALATASGIANVPFVFEGDITLETLGAAGANSTVRGVGSLLTDGYSAATTTRMYALFGGAASPGTATTLDPAITNYINFNVTCSASSSSNTITLLQLLVYGLN